MPFPVRRWAVPVCLLALAAPFASGDAAYHAAERVTDALMSAAADIAVFERKASDAAAGSAAPHVRVAQSGDDWIEALRSGSYWKNSRETSRSSRSAKREKSSKEMRGAAGPSGARSKVALAAHTGSLPRGNGEAYRTVCVRLCDGYYWPISFGAGSAEFSRDSATCEQSCSMPAKLYHAPVLGEAPELVDLNGQAYTKLGTAFQFRTTYNPSCKCRAHPWETEAQQRHRTYAVSGQADPAAAEQNAAPAADAKSHE